MGAGALYGFYHQAKLSTASKLAAIDADYKRKESLIQQAKAEFTRKNAPPSSGNGGGTFPDQLEIIWVQKAWELDCWTSQVENGFRIYQDYFLTCKIVVRSADDPNFDLEAYLNAISAEQS